jgi:large subunit ribosomal protein L22
MKVSAKLKNLRIAPRKVRLTSGLIKGMDVTEALSQLETHVKRSNPYMQKLLESAISNGGNNFGLDKNNLYVFDVIVNAGSTLKRWMPKAYGRAGQILKRTSKIEIILDERVEGKGRKSKEQMEKEKQSRAEERKKAEKAASKEIEEKEKKPARNAAQSTAGGGEKAEAKSKTVENKELSKKVEKKGGITSKIFRRKSM